MAARKPSTSAATASIPSAGSNGVQLPKRITAVELDKLKYDLFSGIPKQAIVTMTNANGGEVYEGQIDAKNKRCGKGTLRWPNGNVYFGTWSEGSMCGSGIFLYAAENDTYKGEFKNDKKHGVGRYEFSNGNFYEGGFAVDKRHGKGRYSWTCGDSYEGDWYEGHMQGRGTTVYSNGNRYDGEFVADRREGRGKLVCADGLSYDGQWAKNMRHGTGRLQFPNGDYYEGDWDNDKKHGNGTDVFVNGNTFVGQYRDNMKHGQGTMTYANGDKYQGEWKGDKMDGQGTYAFSNGFVYEGSWQQDVRHGHGKYSFPSGHVYTGEWRADKRHGAGQLVIAPSGDVYRGVWIEGKMHGAFTVDRHSDWNAEVGSSNATVCTFKGPLRKVYEGMWEQGVPTKGGVFHVFATAEDRTPCLSLNGSWDSSTGTKKSDGTIEFPQLEHWRAIGLLAQLSLMGKKTNHLLHVVDHVFAGSQNRPLMDFYDAELQSYLPSASAQQERLARLKHYATVIIPPLQQLQAQQQATFAQLNARSASTDPDEIMKNIEASEAEERACSEKLHAGMEECSQCEQRITALTEQQKANKLKKEQLAKQKESLQGVKQQVQKLDSQVTAAEKDVAELEGKRSKLREDVPTVRQELLSLREDLDARLTDIRATKQAAHQESARVLAEKEAALKAASKKATDASAKARETKSSADSQLSKLNAQLAILSKQISDSEKQKQVKQKRQADEVRIRQEKDAAALVAARAEVERLEQLLQSTTQSHKELVERCAVAAQKRSDERSEWDIKYRALQDLRDMTNQQTQMLHEADAAAQQQSDEMVALRREEVRAQDDVDAAVAERCRKLRVALENKIKQQATGLSILESEVQDLDKQAEELERRKKSLEDEIAALERSRMESTPDSPLSPAPSSPSKKSKKDKNGSPKSTKKRESVVAAGVSEPSGTFVPPPAPAVAGKLRRHSTAMLRDAAGWLGDAASGSGLDDSLAFSTSDTARLEEFQAQQAETIAELEKRVRAVERQNDEDEVATERLLRQKKALEEQIKSLTDALSSNNSSSKTANLQKDSSLTTSASIDLSEAGKEAVRHQLIKARSKQSTLLRDQERLQLNISNATTTAEDLRRQLQEGSQLSVASIIASLRPEDWRLSYLVEQIEAKGKQIVELESQCSAIPILEERLQSLKEAVSSMQAKQQSSGLGGSMAASSRRPPPF